MADKRISQLIERVDIANNDVLPIVASGATTTNKVTVSTLQDWMQDNLDVGVTSVGLTMPSAFQVSGSPITTSGNITVTATGTASQYIRGDGTLADFPQGGGGGGASVSYYLNGSVSQGTIGGVTYLEMNKTPVLGAGTDFTINANGYIASFITDAGDPGLLEIPGGNWNFETYFQASSGGGTPSFYVELYKVSGSTATLIASNSSNPELIAFGTTTTAYFSSLAVPTTTLALTDRLALRYYVTHSGRTITLHTENSNLCQIITTFTTGLTALNGLTAQVQNFATGTSGTDFNISSSGSIHTFNLPDASASARGVVTTGSQVFGGVKTFADGLSLPSAGGTNQASRFVNIGTIHQGSGGSNQIGFNNSNNIYFGKGLDNGGVIQWSNSAVRYYTLPNADGTLALTSDIPANIVTAPSAGTTNQIPKFTASRQIGNSAISDNGTEISMQPRLFVTSGGQQFVFTPNLGTTSNRIETTGSLPLEIVSGGNITFAAGGATPQITLTSSGAVTFANKITINTPSDGIGVLLNGRTSDNFSSIRFGANTGGGQYNSINVSSSSFDIISIGNTPITFGTNNTGGGGTRMTIGGDGTITLAGALNGTSASFSSTLTASKGTFNGTTSEPIRIERFVSGSAVGRYSLAISGAGNFSVYDAIADSDRLIIAQSTGAATFSSSVTATGNVTISSTTNSSLVAATNSTTGFSFIDLINNAASGRNYQIGVGGNGAATGYANNLYFDLVGSGNIMTLTSGRNVGIGTASPAARLHVNNGTNLNVAFNTTTVDSVTTSRISSFNDAVSASVGLVLNGTPLVFTTSDTERMRITSGGNVGIGTSTFNYSVSGRGYLAINGTSNSIIEMQNNSSAAGYLFAASDNLELTAVGASRFLRFTTNDVEKMRITSGGYLKASNNGNYVNATASYHELNNNSDARVAILTNRSTTLTGQNGIMVYFNNAAPNNTTSSFIACEDSSNLRFIVYSNGNVQNTNNSYGAISDAKLKENVEDASPKLDDLMKVKVRNYNLIGDDKKQIGVIAQELEEVFPAMIDESEDFEEVEVPQVDEEGNEILNEEGEVVTTKERVSKGTTTKSVKYSVFVPMLIKAMQEQQEQIKSLTEQVEALKSQING